MLRKNCLAIVCHCILNQNSVVYDLARASGTFHGIVDQLSKCGYGIYQLPCPELLYGGLKRKSKNYLQYSSKSYRSLCQRLTEKVIKELLLLEADLSKSIVLIGIQQSPTCSITGQRGHFMEYLLPELNLVNPYIKLLEIPTDYQENSSQKFLNELEGILTL